MSKKIYLHGRHPDDYAIVDDDVYEELSKFKWYYVDGYAVRHLTKAQKAARLPKQMHRAVLKLLLGDRIYVDHKNQNKLDNQRHNLRVATGHQNGGNSKKTRGDTSSQFKGVTKRKHSWIATITHYRKTKHLGTFDTEEKAALAYDKAARTVFKEFACVNFPDITDYSKLIDND